MAALGRQPQHVGAAHQPPVHRHAAFLHEQPRHSLVPLLRGHADGGRALGVGQARVSAALEQQLDGLHLAVLRRQVQRRLAVARRHVDRRAGPEHDSHHVDVAVPGRDPERAPAAVAVARRHELVAAVRIHAPGVRREQRQRLVRPVLRDRADEAVDRIVRRQRLGLDERRPLRVVVALAALLEEHFQLNRRAGVWRPKVREADGVRQRGAAHHRLLQRVHALLDVVARTQRAAPEVEAHLHGRALLPRLLARRRRPAAQRPEPHRHVALRLELPGAGLPPRLPAHPPACGQRRMGPPKSRPPARLPS